MTTLAEPAVTPSEQPSLPPGWAQTTLGDVAHVNARPDTSELENDTSVTFIPMAAVQEVCGRYDGSQVRSYGQVKKGYTPFKNGDLIFAKITPCMENGKSALVDGLINSIGYGSTEFHVITSTSALEPKYAFYLVTSKQFRGEAEHNMRGAAGQKRVPPQFLTEYPLALPPLAEQQRIVAKIEELFSKLDAGVAELKRTQTLLKRYRQSLLHAAVTGELSQEWRIQNSPRETGSELLSRVLAERREKWLQSGKKGKYKEPEAPDPAESQIFAATWTTASLSALALQIGDVDHKMPKAETGGVPYISTRDFTGNDSINFKDAKLISPADYESLKKKIFPEFGDLLLSRYGTIGKVRLVKTSEPFQASYSVAIIKLFFNPVTRYVKLALESHHCQRQMKKHTRATAQPDLGLAHVRELAIPLPPLAEQAYIVSEVERRLSVLDNMEETVTAELKRAESTRQSILYRAFAGELVPQDPNDEPASVLLERIQVEKLKTSAKAIRDGAGKRGRPRKTMPQPTLLEEQ
ncbi:restriction endonuclease subunit S [Deinococcus taeanensis]|uniref:restriction endonuclease subunit S n=1 Tax=Deinococcus taeanensis TaxID=2737050 RepID=UPI001CDBD5EE|nr:restriction endonuclease subunit S [Deinococcus taeanensis]UBV43249.1 restriction endonuclease subunit S [Deinococcus taeanensis]